MDENNPPPAPPAPAPGPGPVAGRRAVLGALAGTAAAAALHGLRAPPARAALKPGFDGKRIDLPAADRAFLLESAEIPQVGNPEGDVVLAEFSDFRCPHCRIAASHMRRAMRRDEGVLAVFPSYPILGPDSVDLALMGLAAARQGAYEDWHFTVMTWPGRVRASKGPEIAQQLGLDTGRLLQDAQDPALKEALIANQAFALSYGIGGTPSFIVFRRNGAEDAARLLRGERTSDELGEVFRRLRKA